MQGVVRGVKMRAREAWQMGKVQGGLMGKGMGFLAMDFFLLLEFFCSKYRWLRDSLPSRPETMFAINFKQNQMIV